MGLKKIIIFLGIFLFVVASGCNSSNQISTNEIQNANKEGNNSIVSKGSEKQGGKAVTEEEQIRLSKEKHATEIKMFKEKEWNKTEKDVTRNGNIQLALDLFNRLDETRLPAAFIKNMSPQDVINDINKYYGEKIAFEGKIKEVKSYKPNSQIANLIGGGKKVTSIRILTKENQTVLLYITGDDDYSSFTNVNSNIAGWPVGVTNNELILINKVMF